MGIINEYNRQLENKSYQTDAEQVSAVQKLAQLQQDISHLLQQKQTFVYKAKALLKLPLPGVSGCYIWGDVGRGKTWLMDMFFDSFDSDSLIKERKIRLHFQHFMQAIHDQLSLIDDQKKPLDFIARSFASRYQLICLDEFHVSDITDAMLLYGLLETLLKEGVILVVTSNQIPDNLYKNGLQRERFLPAIKLLKQHCHIVELNGAVDHRLRLLEKADTWHLISDNSNKLLESRFIELITCPAQRNYKIHINYRIIQSILYTDDIIWLDFYIICGDNRGSADYIEIARQFHTVFISNIPVMDDAQNDKTRRFINMIDEFYDRNVNLLSSAESQPELLYTGKQYAFEFKRTISRLQEMRSHEYMQRPHKIS
ncbi:MAG: cell division protein ZapE [Gammaproteobacteria bacterium]|nr:cell division protein ZapE [Gammaproteobacteria bacterium]